MTLNLETTEKTVRWGSGGFGLLTAIISMMSLVADAKNERSIEAESEK